MKRVAGATRTTRPFVGRHASRVFAWILSACLAFALSTTLVMSAIGMHARGLVRNLPATDDRITVMAFSRSGVLYLGGRFTSAGGVARHGVAAVDPRTRTFLPWSPKLRCLGTVCGTGIPPDVDALAVGSDGRTVYIGGNFDEIGNLRSGGLVAVDARSGSTTAWRGPSDVGYAVAVLASGSRVYIASGHIAAVIAVDSRSGKLLWRKHLLSNSLALSADGSSVFASTGMGLTALRSRDGQSIWTMFTDCCIRALAASADGRTLYVGGYFSTVGHVARHGLAALDSRTGKIRLWAPALRGRVEGMPDDEGAWTLTSGRLGKAIYIGGNFDTISGVQHAGLAAVDSKTGAVLSWNPHLKLLQGPRAGVVLASALSPDGKQLFIGCDFTGPCQVRAVDAIRSG